MRMHFWLTFLSLLLPQAVSRQVKHDPLRYQVFISAQEAGAQLPRETHEAFREQFYQVKKGRSGQTETPALGEALKVTGEWLSLYKRWMSQKYHQLLPLAVTSCHQKHESDVADGKLRLADDSKHEYLVRKLVEDMLELVPKKLHESFEIHLIADSWSCEDEVASACGDMLYISHSFVIESSLEVLEAAIARSIVDAQTGSTIAMDMVDTFNVAFFGFGDPDINSLLEAVLRPSLNSEIDNGTTILLCDLRASSDGFSELVQTHCLTHIRHRRFHNVFEEMEKRTRTCRIRDLAMQAASCNNGIETDSPQVRDIRKKVFQ